MRRVIASELMDAPDADPVLLAGNLADIEFANRRFGGYRPVIRSVFEHDAAWLLDVCCGSADVPRELLREARARGRRLEIVALDASDAVLAVARQRAGDEPLLRFVRGDARMLPFPDAAFDIATCTLGLHHFDDDAAVEVLRELRRVARLTPIVCDFERSPLAYVGASLFATFIAKNRFTKHDGPLSVRRAYCARELVALAGAAGWGSPHVRRSAYFRLLLNDLG